MNTTKTTRNKQQKNTRPQQTTTTKKNQQQGTLYNLNGVLSGNLAIVGGTAAFKGLRGTEVMSYNTGSNTGTAKFFVS